MICFITILRILVPLAYQNFRGVVLSILVFSLYLLKCLALPKKIM